MMRAQGNRGRPVFTRRRTRALPSGVRRRRRPPRKGTARGPHLVSAEPAVDPAWGNTVGETQGIVVSNLHGCLVLTAVARAAVVLFARVPQRRSWGRDASPPWRSP